MSDMSQKDFEELCRSIEGSISKVMDAVGKGLDKAGNAANNAINQAIENQKKQQASRVQSAQPSQASQRPQVRPRTNIPVRAGSAAYQQRYANNAIIRSRFKSSAGLTASGAALTAGGAIMTTSFGVAEIVGALTMALSMDPGFYNGGIVGMLVIGVFLGFSIWSLVSGIKRLTLGARLKAFQRIFGDREVCSVKELSERMQLSPAKTIDVARKLIGRGYLPQGRLDDDGTCLMVTNESYNLYLQAKTSYEQRQRENGAIQNAKERAGIGSSPSALPVKARAFIDTVNTYLEEIAALNVAIDDVGLSEQIVHIEKTVGKITERVKSDPSLLDSVSGLDRLDDYYLPQTIKLLTAYEELEEQPVQGENIMSSRKEIENTLNVLSTAYEKLLDVTFEDLSMDVSSDITVLHAILSQEGLTENPFEGDNGANTSNSKRSDG
ncbi:MAG: hypothetical protein HFJ64_05310 [Eggerthellaceae bacterium]|nr:hypothetical protein [Eggerthellaceae bacterium]